MSFLHEVQLDDNFGPFVVFRENLGFIPRLLRAQTLLPRLIEAQAKLESTVLLKERAYPRRRATRLRWTTTSLISPKRIKLYWISHSNLEYVLPSSFPPRRLLRPWV